MNKKIKSKNKIIILISIAALLAISATAILLLKEDGQEHATSNNRPFFSYHPLKDSLWSTAGSTYPLDGLTEEFDGNPNDLPVVDISFHQGNDTTPGNCFVTLAYYNRPIDIALQLKSKQESVSENDSSLSLTEIGANNHYLLTSSGKMNYELYKYNLIGNSSEKLMRGIVLGYINIEKGHIKIEGNCNTPEQLPDTAPILSAVKFEL